MLSLSFPEKAEIQHSLQTISKADIGVFPSTGVGAIITLANQVFAARVGGGAAGSGETASISNASGHWSCIKGVRSQSRLLNLFTTKLLHALNDSRSFGQLMKSPSRCRDTEFPSKNPVSDDGPHINANGHAEMPEFLYTGR